MNAERRYLGLDGFRALARSGTPIETDRLVVVSSMPVTARAIGADDSRLVEFTITTNRVDREQDSIAADGWDFSDYQTNPVVLWCHDHSGPPVARSRELSLVTNGVRSVAEFTPEDMNPFGYMICRLYKGGFMHAVSVGFEPREYTIASDRKYGVNYLKQSLLEYSCVPVPANPDALAIARSKGINLAPMKSWAERLLDDGASVWSGGARRQLEVLRSLSSTTRPMLFDMKTSDGAAVEVTDTEIAQAIAEAVDEAIDADDAMDDAEMEAVIREGVGSAIDDAINRHLGRLDSGRDEPALSTLDPNVATFQMSTDDLTTIIREAIGDEINKHLGRLD